MHAESLTEREFPKGPERHENRAWTAMVQSQVYPHHSDVDWDEYVNLVPLVLEMICREM